GVPALSPQWIPPFRFMPAAEAVSIRCEQYAELAGALAEIVRGERAIDETIHSELETIVRDWFCDVDGDAHQRVADAMLQAPRTGIVDRARCRQHLSGVPDASWSTASDVGRQIRYGLGLHPDWSFHRLQVVPDVSWRRSDKYFDIPEVARLCQSI